MDSNFVTERWQLISSSEALEVSSQLPPKSHQWRPLRNTSGLGDTKFVTNQQLTILSVNRKTFLGKPTRNYIGLSIFNPLPTKEESQTWQAIENALKDKQPANFEYSTYNNSSTQIHFHLTVEPFYSESYDGFEITLRDISYYRQLEQAFNFRIQFENLLSKISADFINLSYNELDEGITKSLGTICSFAGLDRSFVVLFSADKSNSSIHYEWCAEGIPSIFNDIQGVPVAAIPWLFNNLLQGQYVAVREGQVMPPGSEVLQQMMQNLGTRSFIHVPMILQGEVIGFIGFDSMKMAIEYKTEIVKLLRFAGEMIANLLNRKKVEKQIHQLNESLEEKVAERTQELSLVNQQLEAFSYAVSHDLRSPLRQITAFGKLLQRSIGSDLNQKNTEFLDIILNASKRMDQYIEDLLEYSKLDKTDIEQGQVDLNSLIKEVVDAFQYETKKRKIIWEIEKFPEINGDHVLLRQVLHNLIGNAIKYTRHKEETQITLGIHQDNSETLTFFVKDNGAGFDMGYAHVMFDVFKRLHANPEFEGNGIGLATVKRIIERHGGEIKAEGQVGKGACFFVTLNK